jgi:photosystem II stability/assembly factor-like uncharacterized protein
MNYFLKWHLRNIKFKKKTKKTKKTTFLQSGRSTASIKSSEANDEDDQSGKDNQPKKKIKRGKFHFDAFFFSNNSYHIGNVVSFYWA